MGLDDSKAKAAMVMVGFCMSLFFFFKIIFCSKEKGSGDGVLQVYRDSNFTAKPVVLEKN